MWQTSNTPAERAHGVVLLDDARVLDRHLPAGERHHARAESQVLLVQRRAPKRFSHADLPPGVVTCER